MLNAKNKEKWFCNIKRIAIEINVQFLITDILISFSTITKDEQAAVKIKLNILQIYIQTLLESIRKWQTNPIKIKE